MQRKSALITEGKGKLLKSQVEKVQKQSIRIGNFYSKLKTNQKKRFQRIVRAICRRFKIYIRKDPIKLILARQIALNTIRIEQAESDIIDGLEQRYSSDIEKWLFLAQKERREAIETLTTLLRKEGRKKEANRFESLRDMLRDEQDLPKAEKPDKPPSGHDRRHYDDITRTTK